MIMDKFELRETMKLRRKKLSDSEAMKMSSKIRDNLFSLKAFRNSSTIAFYLSIESEREVYTRAMIKDSISKGKRVCVPRVIKDSIALFRIADFDRDLKKGFMGILEPMGGVETIPEIIIVPGIVFDRSGNRIGFGRGYYDKLLSALEGTPAIGLAYSFQVVDKIIPGKYDMKMDYIVTEKEIIDCRT